MRTIWEIIIAVTFVSVMIFGIVTLGEKVFTTQTLNYRIKL